ncbi:hypothetical protein [Gaopeijia maritima]|uniref:Uncharacterized protein n=1 Tax=Gaopeijia maritima TaxID=3119007 RepID=A0ABU9EDR3_9BACT
MLRLPTFIELAAMPDTYLDETRDLLRDYVRVLHFVGAARETRLGATRLRSHDQRAGSAMTADEFLSQAREIYDRLDHSDFSTILADRQHRSARRGINGHLALEMGEG